MHLRVVSLIAVISLFFSGSLAQHGAAGRASRHHERALALKENDNANGTLAKRTSYSGRATWFVVGLGACGQWNVPSDFIVALDTPLFGPGYPGPNCFRMITIQYGSNTQVAQVMDECPTCNSGDLDMSQGLFDSFADPGLGEFQMTWWYNDGGDDITGDDPDPATASTDPAPWTTDQPTSSQWVDPAPWTTDQTTSTTWSDPAPWTTDTPTSTSTPPPTTSTTPTSSVASTTSASSSATGSASVPSGVTESGTPTTLDVGSPASTQSPGAGDGQNLSNLGALVVGLGQIVAGGGSA